MTMKVNDIPEGTEETPAMRLRKARDLKELTRAQLANHTGIPQKSIEKFENGSQEPTLSRLKALSDALGVSTQWIMGESQKETTVSSSTSAIANDNLDNVDEAHNTNNQIIPLPPVTALLERVDDLRAEGFKGGQRQALALIEEIRIALKFFEPNDLLSLAHERGLHQSECKDADEILQLLSEDLSEAEEYCGIIEERIIDTAVLGVDLYSLERAPLIEVADALEDEYELEKPAALGFSWGDHVDFVPLIRKPLRIEAITGDGFAFESDQKFPKRPQKQEGDSQ